MTASPTLNARIIETLYTEALGLSDMVRAAFDLSELPAGRGEDAARVALSCEALRTTTRMMHAVAWLLNHRAFLMGELSAFQLRRHGALAADPLAADPERLALLAAPLQALIAQTQDFYARLLRLDTDWRDQDDTPPRGALRLHERLYRAAS